MKKILGSIVVTICAILVVGCGSEKKLNCSKDFSSSMPSGIKMTQDADITFKGDKINNLSMVMKFELPESYKSNMDTFVDTMNSTYEKQYGKYNGVTVKTEKTSDLAFNVTITMDYKNMSDSDKKALNISGSESYSTNKKDLEKQGYSCK